jgi:hypothetical protein
MRSFVLYGSAKFTEKSAQNSIPDAGTSFAAER